MIETLSYSGLNKILFSPKLFYAHYILGEREESIDSWAVEGSLFDCLLTDPDTFHQRFAVVPGVIPTENTKRLVYRVFKERDEESISTDLGVYQDDILNVLKDMNLHQALKTDEQRLDKILTEDAKNYFKFLCEAESKIVIDNETLDRNKSRADMVRLDALANQRMYLSDAPEHIEVLQQPHLEVDTTDKFGFKLRGIADRIIIDHQAKKITIIDVKTTSKTLADFYPDTYNFYRYDLQAAMYVYLVSFNPKYRGYGISFEFFVVDKYDQFAFFPLSLDAMARNERALLESLEIAKYHIENVDYTLPYQFRNGIFVIT